MSNGLDQMTGNHTTDSIRTMEDLGRAYADMFDVHDFDDEFADAFRAEDYAVLAQGLYDRPGGHPGSFVVDNRRTDAAELRKSGSFQPGSSAQSRTNS